MTTEAGQGASASHDATAATDNLPSLPAPFMEVLARFDAIEQRVSLLHVALICEPMTKATMGSALVELRSLVTELTTLYHDWPDA